MRMEDLGRITGLRNEIRSIEEQIKDLEKWGTIPSAQNPFDVLSNGSSIRVPEIGSPRESHRGLGKQNVATAYKAT